MKQFFTCISILLMFAGLNGSLNAQPQYTNYSLSGTYSGNSWPFNNVNGKEAQLLYLPGNFSLPSPAPAGNITRFSIRANSTAGPTTYTTLTIKMGLTNITTLPTGSFYTGSLTTVYFRASVTLSATSGTWFEFILDTPFPYDPTQSLVVDIGQCGATATGPTSSYMLTSGFRRCFSGTGVGCPFVYLNQDAETYVAGIALATSGPPTCVTTAATSVTGNSATLNGTVNANGLSTTVTFDYGLTLSYGSTVPGAPPIVTGNSVTPVSAAITGLAPNTLYHCRVNGVNAGGTTNGNDITFTTGPPPPTVVTTAATGVGLNTATLNGTVNPNNASTTVTFQYGLTITYGTTVPGVPSPLTGTTVQTSSALVAGLLGNTLYHYRIVGTSSGGISNGNDMTFNTAGPPIVVTNPASNVTNTTAQLNGTVTANNLATTVSFNYGLTTTYGSNIAAVPASVSGNTATAVQANLTGLTFGLTYHFQCVGVNAGGTTLGGDQSFVTGCTPPATPGLISGPVNVCQGGTGYVYSIVAVPGAISYAWTVPVGASIMGGTGTTSITVNYSPTAQYGFVTAAAVGSCGTGNAASLAINVFPPASPTITGPASTCQGSYNNVYITQFGFSNYSWTVSAGGVITAGQGTYAITVTWITCGAQQVTVNYSSLNGCPALNATTFNVTVNCSPNPAISGPNNLCANSGTSTYITQTGFSNYVWTVTSGGTINSGQGTNTLSVTWTGSGPQTVTVNYANANGCSALIPTSYPVTVNPLPSAAGTITGTPALCAGTTGVTYSVSPIPNASVYIWTLPPGATNPFGSASEVISVDFADTATSGQITVYGNNVCGNGTPSPPFNVTVNPIPATPMITLNGDTLSSNAVAGNQWYFESNMIPGATDQIYLPFQNGHYWDVVKLNDCSSDTSNHIYYLGVGVSEPKPAGTIEVYPNPGNGLFKLMISSSQVQTFTLSVTNSLGLKVHSADVIEVRGNITKTLDLRSAPNGVYFILLQNNETHLTKMVVINK